MVNIFNSSCVLVCVCRSGTGGTRESRSITVDLICASVSSDAIPNVTVAASRQGRSGCRCHGEKS